MLQIYKNKILKINSDILEIGNDLIKANQLILEALDGCKVDKFTEAKTYNKNIASKINNIDNEIVSILALHSPEASDLRTLISYLKITNELLSISIKTKNFRKEFNKICDQLKLKSIIDYSIPMQRSTVKALKYAIKMIELEYTEDIQDYYTKVLVSKSKTDDIYEMIENNLKKDTKEIKEFAKYYKMLQALRNSEKISDRAMSIATLLTYARNGGEIH